ncbi:MAG: archaetidylserine decarboxylase [Myxococcota bacterium]
MNDSLYMTFISCLPRKTVARAIGGVAEWEGNSAFSRGLARYFAGKFQLNMDEAEFPLEHYPNLLSLFTRRLKPGARPIDPDPAVVVSPVDGVMSEHGPIEGNTCTQVKGKTFTVDELLGGEARGQVYHGGHFMTIYLSPRHYHRIHTPVAGEIVRYQHLPGHLFPVNAPSVRTVDKLFAVNERLTSFVRMGGVGAPEVAVIKVGAIGVGRIRLAYAELATNQKGQQPLEVNLEPSPPIQKGGELGVFELGSTVVMLFPPGLVQLADIPVGQEVKLGQPIATLNTALNKP